MSVDVDMQATAAIGGRTGISQRLGCGTQRLQPLFPLQYGADQFEAPVHTGITDNLPVPRRHMRVAGVMGLDIHSGQRPDGQLLADTHDLELHTKLSINHLATS